jgi:pimeloyl-ACP methyl ester carboxylesterase
MPQLTAPDGLTINYAEWGDLESPAVVLLHGFTADLRMWAGQTEPFSTDYRVIAPDLRGHGRTDAPEDPADYTMERYRDDLLALLDGLGIDICALVGCSFGGMIAVHFATEHPERIAALVLSDTSAAFDHPDYDQRYREREAGIAANMEIVDRFGPAELGKRAAANISDPFLAEGMRTRYAKMSREGVLGAASVRRGRPNVLPLLHERLNMPVLICTGTEDPVHSASLVMANELPSARVTTFRDTGHGIPSLRADAFNDTVLGFFNDVEEGQPVVGKRTV